MTRLPDDALDRTVDQLLLQAHTLRTRIDRTLLAIAIPAGLLVLTLCLGINW